MSIVTTPVRTFFLALIAPFLFCSSLFAQSPATVTLVDDSIFMSVTAAYTVQPASASKTATFRGRLTDVPFFGSSTEYRAVTILVSATSTDTDCIRDFGGERYRDAVAHFDFSNNGPTRTTFVIDNYHANWAIRSCISDLGFTFETTRLEWVFDVSGDGATFSIGSSIRNEWVTFAVYDETESEYVLASDDLQQGPPHSLPRNHYIDLIDGHRYTLRVVHSRLVACCENSQRTVAEFNNATFVY